jgi:hypothetical protein
MLMTCVVTNQDSCDERPMCTRIARAMGALLRASRSRVFAAEGYMSGGLFAE